jgi:hypothetical protein
MKTYLQRTVLALMVCALASATAFADKIRKAQLTMSTDVMVNGTLVKKGAYEFRFNEESGELSILKNGNVKAKTAAKLETQSEKASNTAIVTRKSGDVSELIGLTFGGSAQKVVVTPGATSRNAN